MVHLCTSIMEEGMGGKHFCMFCVSSDVWCNATSMTWWLLDAWTLLLSCTLWAGKSAHESLFVHLTSMPCVSLLICLCIFLPVLKLLFGRLHPCKYVCIHVFTLCLFVCSHPLFFFIDYAAVLKVSRTATKNQPRRWKWMLDLQPRWCSLGWSRDSLLSCPEWPLLCQEWSPLLLVSVTWGQKKAMTVWTVLDFVNMFFKL